MLYQTPPASFSPVDEVVGCFCEREGEILFLQRANNKREGGKWGIPSGKVEAIGRADGSKINPLVRAVRRELQEETGLILPDKTLFFYINTFYLSYKDPDYDFKFHLYYVDVSEHGDFSIALRSDEHLAYRWSTLNYALATLDLVQDFPEVIRRCFVFDDPRLGEEISI